MSGIICQYLCKRQYETKERENVPELNFEDRTISENLQEFTQCHLGLDKKIIKVDKLERREDRNYLKDTGDKQSLTNTDAIHLDNTNTSKNLEIEFYNLLDKLITDRNPIEDGILILDGKSKQPTPGRRSETEIKFNFPKLIQKIS